MDLCVFKLDSFTSPIHENGTYHVITLNPITTMTSSLTTEGAMV